MLKFNYFYYIFFLIIQQKPCQSINYLIFRVLAILVLIQTCAISHNLRAESHIHSNLIRETDEYLLTYKKYISKESFH